MSYAVYTTRAFVLGSAPSGEASKLYSLYTEEFGLVRAKAQGVRLLASKLRYNIDDYAFATFSLVKGKEVWRVTGAEKAASGPALAKARARVLSVARRLVQGEERSRETFAALLPLADDAAKPEDADAIELLAIVRLLAALGYLPERDLSLDDVRAKRRELVAEANAALRETQL